MAHDFDWLAWMWCEPFLRGRFDRDFSFQWDWGGWGPRGRGRRRGKWFEAGEMRYVILKLLKEKPRHGYEIMKDLEERFQGCYQPSPGTVYPTLQWLEDEGLVSVADVQGKKVYSLTPEGEKFLEEHKDRIADIFDRVAETVDRVMGGANPDVHRAVGRLVASVYKASWKIRDDEVRLRIAKKLDDLTDEVEEMLRA